MTRSRKRKLRRKQSGQAGRKVASVLPLAPLLLAGAPVAHAQQVPSSSPVLEEVVVTAQKTEENLQSVPISIQAFGTTKLEELNINNMVDYMQFMPSVTFQTAGPGFTRVFMRGVASGDNGNHSGPMPSVGQYLDEQPITTIQGSLDIHIYDIERVEMLAGPQGTLYGASSQAGTIRTITNKPDPKAFSASYDIQGNYVEHGDAGYTFEGYANIPITENSAVRLVGWYEHSPGYIDNVRGTMTFPSTGYVADNKKYAKDNYNDGDTYGARALLKIDLNDNWSIMPGIMGQAASYNGIFAYDPAIGDLEVTHFNPEKSYDSWIQSSLTIQGKIGNWDMTYAGAYLDRHDVTRLDYSDYTYWYDVCCGYVAYWPGDDGAVINPTQFIRGKDGYTMWSNELRFSSPRDERLRFTGGFFGQTAKHSIEQRYMIDDLASDLWVKDWPDTIWLTEQDRKDGSYAVFGELYYDFTDKLTGTLGYRAFWTDNSLKGFFGYGIGYSPTGSGEAKCFPGTVDSNGDYITDPSQWKKYQGAPCKNLSKSSDQSGGTPKVNLAYKFDDDRMVYLTYSEGFRPGGANRRGDFPPYKADYLTNYEFGWKTTWAGGAVRFNGAAFMEIWDKFQYSYTGLNGLTNVKNAGQAEIDGIEAYVEWAASEQWRFSAGATWLDPKLTENFCQIVLPWDDDGDPDTPPSNVCPDYAFAKNGTQLPVVPTFKGNIVAQYLFNVGGFDGNVQASYVYQNDVGSDLIPWNEQWMGKQDGYGLADLSASFRKGEYSLTFFINNLFDERADLWKYQECVVEVCATAGAYDNEYTPTGGYGLPHPYTTYTGTNQPRTFGLTFRQEFGGSH